VYQVANKNMFIIQQRSLCIKGRQKAFAASLLAWLQSTGFSSAVVLTGASTEDLELSARFVTC
jgi:predicted ATP-grasp superfamily ATP-dependent carboligase